MFLEKFNEKVKNFVKNISEQGHTIISVRTQIYGERNEAIRTEILYRENITRDVIFEKVSS